MLCINHNDNAYKNVVEEILKLGNITDYNKPQNEQIQEEYLNKNSEIVEYLSESIEDILAGIIDISLLNSGVNLRPEKKQEIISALYDKGVFNIKGAVLKVADLLHMSEQSVYRYLKKVDKS
nr:helix-turn-helix domain-containing protein [Campylobacter geochelonis]